MANGSKHVRWIAAIGAAVLIAVLLRSSFQATRQQYDVCMSFNGAAHCATANGSTPAQAIRSAETIDCQLLTNGRDENIACLAAQPTSVRQLK